MNAIKTSPASTPGTMAWHADTRVEGMARVPLLFQNDTALKRWKQPRTGLASAHKHKFRQACNDTPARDRLGRPKIPLLLRLPTKSDPVTARAPLYQRGECDCRLDLVIGTTHAQQPCPAPHPLRPSASDQGRMRAFSRPRDRRAFERADVVRTRQDCRRAPNIAAADAEVIDAARMIVVLRVRSDTHRHMWQGILRNVLPDGSLDDYIATVQKKFGASYAPLMLMPAITSTRSVPSTAA